MRIAQVAPLYESVPPKLYGGTERVVSYLTEELVRQGHEVTLFASGDSLTEARLVPVCKQSLRLSPDCVDPLAHHVLLVEHVLDESENFDLIHFHIDYLHYPANSKSGGGHLNHLARSAGYSRLGASVSKVQRCASGFDLGLAT